MLVLCACKPVTRCQRAVKVWWLVHQNPQLYEAYKQGKKRELSFYWHIKRNQFNVRFEKNHQCSHETEAAKIRSCKLDVAVSPGSLGQVSWSSQQCCCCTSQFIFRCWFSQISFWCLWNLRKIQHDWAHSAGQTERPFPSLYNSGPSNIVINRFL